MSAECRTYNDRGEDALDKNPGMMETNLLIWTGAKLRKVWVWVALRRTILMYGYDARELSTSQTQGTAVWRQAIDRIGPTIRQRIRALVSDGLPGAAMICRQNRWVHQRCHWHILAPFTGSRNRRLRVRTLLRKTRDVAYKAIRLAINTTDQETLRLALGVLQTLMPMIPHRAWKFPGIIRQFTQDIDDFRAYQLHPELGLPATTGVVESLHAKMRPITSRVHSPEAVRRRVACPVRLFPSMRCNRRHYQ